MQYAQRKMKDNFLLPVIKTTATFANYVKMESRVVSLYYNKARLDLKPSFHGDEEDE